MSLDYRFRTEDLWRYFSREKAAWFWSMVLLAAAMLTSDGRCWAQEYQTSDSFLKFNDSPADVLAAQEPWLTMKWDRLALAYEFERHLAGYQDLIGEMRSDRKIRSQRSAQGGDSWLHGLANESFEFSLSFGHYLPQRQIRRDRRRSLILWYNQIAPEPDELNVRLEPEGPFEMEWSRPADGFWFRFVLATDGRVAVTLVHENGAVYLAEEDMWALCTRHAEIFEFQLAPVFRRCGIQPPLTPASPEVVSAVIGRLRPVDPDRLSRFMERVELLNDDNFNLREQATLRLAQEYSEWNDLIARFAVDPALPPESRTRLKKLMETADDDRATQARTVIDQLGLVNDRNYLNQVQNSLAANLHLPETSFDWLVQRIKSLRDSELTGNDEKPLQQESDEPASAAELDSLLVTVCDGLAACDGPLNEIADVVSELFPIRIDQGRLVLDREYWGDLFGGRNVQELIERVRSFVKENHLPGSWFRPGGPYLEETLGYPQLLFEGLNDVVSGDGEAGPSDQTPVTIMMIAGQSRNREFENESLTARLLVHPPVLSDQRTVMVRMGQVIQPNRNTLPDVPDEQFLLLYLSEPQGARREMRLYADPDGRIAMTLTCPEGARMVHLSRSGNDGLCRCIVWSQGKTREWSAPNFEDLVKLLSSENRDRIIRCLAKTGISVRNLSGN